MIFISVGHEGVESLVIQRFNRGESSTFAIATDPVRQATVEEVGDEDHEIWKIEVREEGEPHPDIYRDQVFVTSHGGVQFHPAEGVVLIAEIVE